MDTKKLRQKILDLAIRGKLVPQDPNDEPASVLLERIRAEKERLIKEGKIKRSKKDTSDTPHYENINFDVPSSWKVVTLSDIFFMHAGKAISATDISADNRGEYRYLCVGGNGKRGYVTSYNTDGPHPIIGRQGALCGNINYVDGLFYATEHAVVVDTFCETNTWWAYYFLTQLNLNQYATATAQPGLSVNTIGDVQIPLPPYDEQKRIVTSVEQWFSLINTLENVKDDLQTTIAQTKSKILDLAIHGKLVPQDPNDEPAIELLRRINPKFTPCDNAHKRNDIPNSWIYTTLGSIFNHNTGKALNKSDSQEGQLLPYITTSNVYWNRFELAEIKEMYFKDSEIEKCTITKGDLLVCEGGDIGRSAVWPYEYDMCIQNHIHRLRAKGDISHTFYLYVLILYKWTDKIHGKGIGLQGLSSGLLDKLEIPLPPYKEQLRIVSKIEEIFAVFDELQKSIEA